MPYIGMPHIWPLHSCTTRVSRVAVSRTFPVGEKRNERGWTFPTPFRHRGYNRLPMDTSVLYNHIHVSNAKPKSLWQNHAEPVFPVGQRPVVRV